MERSHPVKVCFLDSKRSLDLEAALWLRESCDFFPLPLSRELAMFHGMLTLTENAARHLRTMIEEKGEPGKSLRIFIERGGCAGMSYGMTLDAEQPGDFTAERDGVKVVVDPASIQYLQGSTIDYCDDLAGTGFRIQNPNATRSCGCGTSFEPAEGAAASH